MCQEFNINLHNSAHQLPFIHFILNIEYITFLYAASTPPNLSTCRISVTDSQGQDTHSGYLGNDTSCINQRDEWIKTQPRELHFAIKADHNPNISKPVGVSEVKAGVVGAIIKLISVSLSGVYTPDR